MVKRKYCILACVISASIPNGVLYAQSAEYSHDASIAGGYNSNVYRAPESNYIDWGKNPSVAIAPNVQSGFFTKLDYKLEGLYSLNKKTAILGGAKFGGTFYLDSDLTNANQTKYTLDFGAKHILSGKKYRVQTIKGAAIIDSVDKTYYDRDTGLEKTAGVTDVADRFSYRGTGVELEYKNKTDKTFRYGGDISIGSRDYTDTIANSQMDYSYVVLGADMKYQLQKSTALSVGVSREVQDYDERPSRDINGRLFTRHPALEYTYLTLSVGVVRKINSWTLYGDYKNITRDDGWVNYNDYTAHKFKLRAIHKAGNIRTKFSLSKQSRDYPNALAFDKLVDGVSVNKTFDTTSLSLSSGLQQTKHRSLWGKVAYADTDTNDLRYKYDRFILSVGYRWKY